MLAFMMISFLLELLILIQLVRSINLLRKDLIKVIDDDLIYISNKMKDD